MMKMLVALSLQDDLLNLALRQCGITRIRCQQCLHRKERPARVGWHGFEHSGDSFLCFLPLSEVLQRERGLESPQPWEELFGIAHLNDGLLVSPLVQQVDSDSVTNACIQRV